MRVKSTRPVQRFGALQLWIALWVAYKKVTERANCLPMLFIDVKTVLLVTFATDVICTFVLIQLWRQSRRRFKGTGLWVLGYAFHTMGLSLVIARNIVPDWLSFVLSNLMIISGVLLIYMGLEHFVGKKSRQGHNYLLLAAFLPLQSYFSFVQPNLRFKIILLSTSLLILAIQCSWLMFVRAAPHTRPLTRDVGIVFGIFGLINIFRICRALVTPDCGQDLFDQGPAETIFLILYQLMLVLATYGLSLMVNRRLLSDIESEEEKFSKAFHCSPYAITLTHPSDGRIIEVNEAFLNTTGYSHAEVRGKTTLDFCLWRSKEHRDNIIDRLTRTGSVRGLEGQFRNKAGEMRTGLVSAEIITLNNGKSILSSIIDITNLKQAEEERMRLEHRLQQARKAESLGRMAGAIAHKFNNMLAAVIGNLDLAMHQLHQGSELKPVISEAMKASKRAADVSRFMLTYLGQIVGNPQEVDLVWAVREACALLEPSIPQAIHLLTHFPDGKRVISIDIDHVRQILYNLLINAVEAVGAQKGNIEITVGTTAVAEFIDSVLFPPEWEPAAKDYVYLSVADTGEGMNAATLQNIFDPFFSTRFTGRGLGLPVVLGLTRTYDGAISVESSPGSGATFRVFFPGAPAL